jgi:proline iminopeptidase
MLEAKGGPRARAVAEQVFIHADEAAMEEYARICLPLYNPKPDPDGGQSRGRAIVRNDVARQFFLGEMRSMHLRAGLARVRCPTLVLAGAHDLITPASCSEEIAACLPAGLGHLEVFEDAGHGVHRDDPDRAESVLRAFLSS